MPSFLSKLSDWDILDMAEGLRYPSSLEKEMAVRLRRLLEAEREKIFNQQRSDKK